MDLLEFVRQSCCGTCEPAGHPPVMVAYNAGFDAHFIAAEFVRTGLNVRDFPKFDGGTPNWIDPLVWIRKEDRYAKGTGRHKLSTVAQRWGVPAADAHRALGDVKMTAGLLRAMKARGVLPEDLDQLLVQQSALKGMQDSEYWHWKLAGLRQD
jgi:DNA polymerase III epsilon subunit-like protein